MGELWLVIQQWLEKHGTICSIALPLIFIHFEARVHRLQKVLHLRKWDVLYRLEPPRRQHRQEPEDDDQTPKQ